MTWWSKPLTNRSCTELFHPGIPCRYVPINIIWTIAPGISKLLAIMYIAENMFSKKKLTKKVFLKLIKNYLRSVAFGIVYVVALAAPLCIQWNLLGKLTYWSPATLGGLFVFINTPDRRHVESCAFAFMAIETLVRAGASNGLLPRSKFVGAIVFMLSNALIFYLMWMKLNHQKDYAINWLLKPSIWQDNSGTICFHEGSCWKQALVTTKKYCLAGLLFSIAKVIPKIINGYFSAALNPRNFRIAAFFTPYVFLFKVTNCGLNNFFGKEDPIHSAIAGFIAGISYMVRPSISLSVNSLVILAMFGWSQLVKQLDIPKLPFSEMSFIISSGLLLHCMFHHPRYLPKFYVWMTTLATRRWLYNACNRLWIENGIKIV